MATRRNFFKYLGLAGGVAGGGIVAAAAVLPDAFELEVALALVHRIAVIHRELVVLHQQCRYRHHLDPHCRYLAVLISQDTIDTI